MKAALNGCLNLSILDGWWDEWYDGSNGWAIPTADGVTDVDRRDDLEAGALYDLIENSVAAGFYDRGPEGLPTRWLEMVRHTLTTLGPKVLADRMVKDYVDVLYAPAALAGRAITGPAARELAEWKAHVRRSWHGVRVDHVESGGIGDAPEVGNTLSLRVFVSLGELAPSDVEVQVVHGRVDDADRLVDGQVAPLKAGRRDEHGRWFYEGSLALDRTGPFGYTVRVMPTHALLAGPAELGLIAVPPEGESFAEGMPLR
jgi:starch phosphorylase